MPKRNSIMAADMNTSKQSTAGSQAVQGMVLQNKDACEGGQQRDPALNPSAHDSAEYIDIDTYKVADVLERPFWSNGSAYPERVGQNEQWQPIQLANGKWLCKHKCKNKSLCKHLCCHEGLDQPPKQAKRSTSQRVPKGQETKLLDRELTAQNRENAVYWPTQLTEDQGVTKSNIEEVDLTKDYSTESNHGF